MRHRASPGFWKCYDALPEQFRNRADRAFTLLKANPSHPSLHFKKVGEYWSARIDLNHRALALRTDDGYLWFWIGTHDGYDRQLP